MYINNELCYGGISNCFIHATKTESNIKGLNIFDETVLQRIVKGLYEEIQPESMLTAPSVFYRKTVACSLFYKFIISIAPPHKVNKLIRSGGSLLKRPVSFGTQNFENINSNPPVHKPINKIEGN